jgi:hypothetical protein
MPVISSGEQKSAPSFDHFSQGRVAQTDQRVDSCSLKKEPAQLRGDAPSSAIRAGDGTKSAVTITRVPREAVDDKKPTSLLCKAPWAVADRSSMRIPRSCGSSREIARLSSAHAERAARPSFWKRRRSELAIVPESDRRTIARESISCAGASVQPQNRLATGNFQNLRDRIRTVDRIEASRPNYADDRRLRAYSGNAAEAACRRLKCR